MKTRYNSFDAMRFICAFLVVALHAPFPENINWFLEPLCRCAVPMFFMISGFFMYDPDAKVVIKKAKKQVKHLTRVFIISWIFYFIWWSMIEILGGNSLITLLINTFNPKALLVWVVFNKPYVGDITWYLQALIYVELMYLVLAKYRKQNMIWSAIIPCIILYLSLGKYSLLVFNKSFDYYFARNFIFDALPYFALGNYFAAKKKEIHTGNHTLILLLLIFYACNLFEKAMLIKFGVYIESHHYIMSTPLLLCAFAFLIKNATLGKTIGRLGRKYSLCIYLVQMYFIDFIEIGLNKFGLVPTLYYYIAPVIIFAFSFAAAYIIDKLIIRSKLRIQT